MSKRMILKVMIVMLSASMLALALKGNESAVKAEGEVATIKMLNPDTGDSFFILKASDHPIGSTFTVNVSITSVKNLVMWGILISWNNTIITFQDASIPDDNVFASAIDGATLVPLTSDYVTDDTGYLQMNATLSPETPVDVTDLGVLCQVNFTIQKLPDDEALYTEITFVEQGTFVVLEDGQKPVFTTPAYICLLNFTPNPDITNDGSVKLDDITAALDAFGSFPTHPRWNPHADLDLSGRVMLSDVSTILQYYGKSYP